MSVANNLTGKTLSNRYEILRPLGEGGMGKVYLAKDKRFGKQVVVKVPTMEAGDKEFKDRFMREIASLATLEHAHIVTTVDWGEIEGIPFLVLRYLGGGSLRDRITDAQGYYKPMPLEGLNQWLPQIASALDFIHTKNWVHRDLKPDNILFDEAGNPYLADFGIAKALEGAPMGVKTTMGAFIGTPQYMAPEMHLGKGIGPRADQFGLAVLVYEALAGKIPFAGTTPTAIFVEVMQGKARPIHELVPGIPLEKSNALMKGITKEPRDRYGSCVEFANAITGSMLARGTSPAAGSETPSRVVIPGTRIETPSKPEIAGTRIETPSKPEILGIKNETPTKPVIAGTKLETPSKPELIGIRNETPSKPEILGTKLETPSKSEINVTRLEKTPIKPDRKLLGEDYLTKEGQLLAQLCRDLVESGKVTKELFLEARKFFKNNNVTEMPGGMLLEEKIETIVKTGHVSKDISEDIVLLAREILGLGKPEIADARMTKPTIRDTAKIIAQNEKEQESGYVHKIDPPKTMRGELDLNADWNENIKIVLRAGIISGGLGFIFLIVGLTIFSLFKSSGKSPTELITSIEKEMLLIPAGRFMMGDQGDRLQVTLTRTFYMGKYEVTQEQWEAVMEGNPSSKTEGAKLPVTNVSWEECQEFIKKLNAKTNGGYRLPTEAEWEYACRAGTSTAYSVGASLTNSDANIEGDSIKAAGSYKPNAFGLYDMHGNVWEWCNDWYGDYLEESVTDPKGAVAGTSRVLRGGSFFNGVSLARSSFRNFVTPSYRDFNAGFRLARTGVSEITVETKEAKKELTKSFQQEEEAKAKQMELVKLKQEEETKLNANAFNKQGKEYYNGQKYAEAIAEFTKAIDLDPKFVFAYDNRGRAYASQQKYTEAISDYTKAIELDPKYPAAYFNRGNASLKLENYLEAIADYSKAIELDPTYAAAYSNRGRAYANQQKFTEAIAEYTKAIVLDPMYAAAYYNRGRVNKIQQKYPEAIADYSKAIELDPKEINYYFYRGIAYADLKKYPEAIVDYSKAIELDPKYDDAYFNRGFAYSQQQKYSEAIADYTKAIGLNPKLPEFYLFRGFAYGNLKRYPEAITDLTKAIELDPKAADAYNARGRANADLKKYPEAIADYSKAIELDPKEINYYFNRGNAYNLFLKSPEAIADYTKAIELDPKNVRYYNNRGLAYADLKKYAEAIADYTKAIEMDPKFKWAYYNRGDMYKALGKTKEADADFAKAKALEK